MHQAMRPGAPEFATLRAVLCRQPAWADRRDAVVAFRVLPNPNRRRTLILQVQLQPTNAWTMVSWARGTSSRAQRPNQLRAALRCSIESQTYAWGLANARAGCAVCGTHALRQVDHEPVPFAALVRAFLATEPGPLPQTFRFDNRSRVCFRAADAAFEQRWQAYHQREAHYQWLCEHHHRHKAACA